MWCRWHEGGGRGAGQGGWWGRGFQLLLPTETLNLEIGENPPWSVLPNLFESLKTLIKAFKVCNETSLGTWYAVMFWEQHLTFFFLIYLRDKWLGAGARGNYFIILWSVSFWAKNRWRTSHFKQNDVPRRENLLLEIPFTDDFYFPKDLKSHHQKLQQLIYIQDCKTVFSGSTEAISLHYRS